MKLYSVRNKALENREYGDGNGEKKVRMNGVAILLGAVLLILVTAAVTTFIAYRIYKNRLEKERTYKVVFSSETDPYKVAKFQDIIDYIDSNFVLDYTDDALIEGAIKGYIDALGDRYSYYLEPGDYENYNEYITGTFTGIGITATYTDEGMTVNEVFDNSPAKEAGLLPGDLITYVNGLKADTTAVSAIQSSLSQEGVIVRLKVKDAAGAERELELKTAVVNRQSVYGVGYEDGIYYVRVTQFDSDTGTEFEQMLEVAKEAGMKALILDLRGNPGGFEKQADEVADAILGEGIIAYSKDRNGKVISEARSDAAQIEVPIVLLVNKNTASASELVAGAFRDFKRGTIIGTRTYGKAIGQLSRSYDEDGSGVVITTAIYFTPSGECIHGVGILPDTVVELADEYANLTPDKIPEGQDAQLDKAFEILRAGLSD